MDDLLSNLAKLGCAVEPCGSRVTCDPAPVDTDEDFLVVVPSDQLKVAAVVDKLGDSGFRWEGSEHYQIVAAGDFMSWRKGVANLIVTANEAFAARHRAATHVCKRLNLLKKQDRVALFQAVLYGNKWDEEIAEKGDAV